MRTISHLRTFSIAMLALSLLLPVFSQPRYTPVIEYLFFSTKGYALLLHNSRVIKEIVLSLMLILPLWLVPILVTVGAISLMKPTQFFQNSYRVLSLVVPWILVISPKTDDIGILMFVAVTFFVMIIELITIVFKKTNS
jgi:hypothetical protein